MPRRRRRSRRLAEVFEALSDELRLGILTKLRDEELSFAELMRKLRLDRREDSRLSYHLRKLQRSGLVEFDTKVGKYRLSRLGADVAKWLEWLEGSGGREGERAIADLGEERVEYVDVRSYVRGLMRELRVPARDAREVVDEVCAAFDGVEGLIDAQDVEEAVRAALIKMGLREHARLLGRVGLPIPTLRRAVAKHSDALGAAAEVGVRAIRCYVMRELLSEELVRMHLSGEVTIAGMEHLPFAPHAVTVPPPAKLPRSVNELMGRLRLALKGGARAPHVTALLTPALASISGAAASRDELKRALWALCKLDVGEATSSLTLVVDCLPSADADVDLDRYVKAIISIIRIFAEIHRRGGERGVVLELRFRDFKELLPYVSALHRALARHAPVTLLRAEGDEVAHCGVLISRGSKRVSLSVAINLPLMLLNSGLDVSLLHEKARVMGNCLREALSNPRLSRLGGGSVVVSLHGLDGCVLGLTGQHIHEGRGGLSRAKRLAREVLKAVREPLGDEVELMASLGSLDYAIYRRPCLRPDAYHREVREILRCVNATSALSYHVLMPLDVRARVEGALQRELGGGGLLNVHVSEPFPSLDSFSRIVELVASRGVVSFTVTQDYTVCEICGSEANDLVARCPRCSFHLTAASHYGRVLGYYERLDRLPEIGREEYYSRRKLSVII